MNQPAIDIMSSGRNYDPWNPTTPRNAKGQAQVQELPEERCGSRWLEIMENPAVLNQVRIFLVAMVIHNSQLLGNACLYNKIY